VNILQIRFIATNCTLYTLYKLLQHLSADTCSRLQEVHTKVMIS